MEKPDFTKVIVSYDTTEEQDLYLPIFLLTHNPTWFPTWTFHPSHVLLSPGQRKKQSVGKGVLENKEEAKA